MEDSKKMHTIYWSLGRRLGSRTLSGLRRLDERPSLNRQALSIIPYPQVDILLLDTRKLRLDDKGVRLLGDIDGWDVHAHTRHGRETVIEERVVEDGERGRCATSRVRYGSAEGLLEHAEEGAELAQELAGERHRRSVSCSQIEMRGASWLVRLG